MDKKIIGALILSCAIMVAPLISSADTMSDLQAQINSLLQQLHSNPLCSCRYLSVRIAEEKAAALKFLGRIMRPQSDHAFVMGFGGDLQMWQTSTADRAQLMDALNRLHQAGWGTRFYDALYSACNEYLSHPDGGSLVHRAVVVLSDGDDTQSFRELRDVLAIALRGEIQIYALTLHRKKQAPRSDAVLQSLADETGGRFYVAQSSKDLDGAFAQIEQDLRTQYYVSFPPQQVTPGFHALHLEVRSPRKLQVHARQGYYVSAQ